MSVFTAQQKIKKANNAQPDKVEQAVAQALYDLESTNSEFKSELKSLYISAAKEVTVPATPQARKAVVVFVPYKLLANYQKIQPKLIRELEKKFSGEHVVIIGQRRILPKFSRTAGHGQKARSRKYTLTAVHDAILKDLVHPTEIVGRRLRYKLDGKVHKVQLDPKDKDQIEHKLDTFSTIYNKLTGKTVVFEFPDVSADF